MQLNIFEPRYRLLVRRCMEGNRRFGMATVNQLGQLSEVACQGEILECMPLPDGYVTFQILINSQHAVCFSKVCQASLAALWHQCCSRTTS